MERIVVAIMAKAPRVGEVKTRLCPPLSPPEAAALYRGFLLDKIEQVRGLREISPAVAYTPPDGRTVFEQLAPEFTLVPQRGGDLGSRLANSFDLLLAKGYAGALAIDSDTPTLPTWHLQEASRLIARPEIDVVLGPAEDGGYYLIGLRNLHRDLFEDMAWSTARILPETIRRAEAKGLTVACVPPWFDVDTPEDLERLKASLGSVEEPLARHTRHFFRERAR